MTWVDRYLSEQDKKNISEAVKKAEVGHDGEIVPVIVRRSSSIGHVPMTLTLLILLVLIFAGIPHSEVLWVTPWIWAWPVIIVAIYYLSHLLARLPWLQRILVPERDEVEQVHNRAHLEFFVNEVDHTEHQTGVLIFISVMERKAVILVDKGLSAKVPQETWDKVLDNLGGHLRRGEWAAGFTQAIEECGRHLKTHFPIAEHHDQLSNELIIKE